MNIDIFTSHINKKCKRYISLLYVTLRKIKMDKAEGNMVVLEWPSQPWYPLFKSMLIDQPIIFNPDKNLLISSDMSRHPL